jgi:hypothetical protein
MTYLALCLICIVAIELFMLLPFLKSVARLGEISRKSAKVISSSRISDHWKEKALQRYSRDMAVCSITLGFYMAIVFGVVMALALALDAAIQPQVSTLDYAMTMEGLLLATGFAFLYIFVRKRLVPS